jgi:PAS domain S-box-containing protein
MPRPFLPTASATAIRQGRGARAWPWPVAVLVVGGLLTVGAALRVHQEIDQQAQTEFGYLVHRIAQETERRFKLPVHGLMGARGAYAASPQLSGAQFRAYVESRDLSGEFPGIRGLGFIQRVLRDDLPRFQAAVRAEGAQAFSVNATGTAADLYVIRYIEPLAANLPAWGYDLGSDPKRRSAVETAILAGRPTLSESITLLQDAHQGPGFLFLLPVYHGGVVPENEEDRLRLLHGVLYMPIVAREIFEGVAEAANGRLDFEVFDGPDTSRANLVYDLGQTPHKPSPNTPVQAYGRHFETRVSLTIGDRVFGLRARSLPTFDSAYSHAAVWAAALGGAALTLLAAWAAWLLAAGRARIQQRARELTADLDRLAQIVEHTSNAASLTDAQGRITWINAAFTRLSGYTREEALGRTPKDLVDSGKNPPEVLAQLQQGLREGIEAHAEVLNRAKDGHEYWLHVDVQPMRDADGTITGFMEIGTDITATHAAAEALAQERARLARIIASTHAGEGEINVRTGELRMSERWAAMLGYTLQEIEPLARSAGSGLFHPDDLLAATTAMKRYLQGQAPVYELEHRMRHRDGHWVWLQGRGSVSQRDAQGRPEWVSGVHIDITERREATRRWQARAELSADWFWQTDVAHRFIELSLGDDRAHLIDRPAFVGHRRDEISAIEPPDEGWAAFHARLDRHEPFAGIVYRARNAAGDPAWWEIDGRPRFDEDGRFLGYEGVGRDITARRRITDDLRESLLLVDTLFQSIPIPVVLKDNQGRYLRMNKAGTELFGSGGLEVLGKTVDELADPAVAALHGEHDLIVQGTRELCSYEVHQRFGHGPVIDALVSKAPVVDAAGQVIGMIATVVDISRSKDAERAMAEARAVAEAANNAKSAFLATMSHEIRTPMNGVVGMAELLQHSPLDEEQAQTVRTIVESAQSLLGLIDDILDFSKIEAGRLELEQTEFDLTPLVEGVCAALSPLAVARDVRLTVCIAPQVSERVVGDPMRVRQLLNNLVGNAIKFSAGQPGRKGAVAVRVDPEGPALRFSVADNGIGMDAATQARLFTPFTQAEVSTTRRFGGTGLGLAICRRLVEMMSGHIGVESAPGAGATFSFTLPLPAAAEQPPSEPPLLAGLDCILVPGADLPEANLRQWLQQAGARVARAPSLAQAQADAAAGPGPTLLLHGDAAAAMATSASPQPPGSKTLQLLVAYGRRETLRRLAPGVATVDLLRRDPFLRAVATLAGRALPEAATQGQADLLVGERLPPPTPEQAQARGQLILVAEDDPTNRAVLKRQLGLLGYAAEFAENGRRALELWREDRHALLLTDLHMPEMDGYELAQAIRQDEQAQGRTARPLLALTANAVMGEATQARFAGLDDYLTKPVPLRQLQEALNRSMPPPAPPALQPPPATTAEPMPVLDLQCPRALIGDEAAALNELLADFLDSARPQAAALGAALQAGDAVRCGKLAHALKSASRSVGALALGQLCAELELAPSGGDGAAHHTRFAAAFSAAAAAIEAHLQSCKMAAT